MTEVPLMPVAPPNTNEVIRAAETALTRVTASQTATMPDFLLKKPARAM